DKADALQLTSGERHCFDVVHLPDLVALEAEVLDAETRCAWLHHRRAPGAEVLHATRANSRVVEVDPVVGERLRLRRDQPYYDEVAVAQLGCSGLHGRRRRRVEALDEIPQREAGHDPVDRVLLPVSVRLNDDAVHVTLRVPDRNAARVATKPHAVRLDVLRERLPHLPRPEPGVLELLEQRRDMLTIESEDRQDGLPE